MQVSGLVVKYDLSRPVGSRLVSAEVGGRLLDDAASYTVATNSFLAQGGDLYTTFLEATGVKDSGVNLSAIVVDYLKKGGTIGIPPGGRLVPVTPQARPSSS